MKTIIIAIGLALSLAGCVVDPPRVHPVGVGVRVAPVYPRPAPGYIWRQHPRYGWGWHHPRMGWHHRDWD
ncbi:MAG: hypothetical protein PHU14_11170 [Methylovulum sp.]|nr:hypothetical protein [Methylovulum sp.]